MVGKIYNRSLSFPLPSSTWSSSCPKIKGRGSTSLPTRFHPFLAPLRDQIDTLLTWQHSRPSPPSFVWVRAGLAHLESLHSSLDELLQHPKAQDQLRRRSAWTDGMLEDFLRFADAYMSFRSAAVDLKDRIAAHYAAISRHGGALHPPCLRREQKEVARIAAGVRRVGRWGAVEATENEEEAELAAVLGEAVAATAAVSAAVFAEVAGMAAAAVVMVGGKEGKWWCGVGPGTACIVGSILRRMGSTKEREEEEERLRREKMGRLEVVEECIVEAEKGCERLFRALVNSRVFLLNTFTPCI